MFKKLKKRFTKWKNWREYTNLSLWSQLMVLFGVKYSVSFDAFKSINDFEDYKDFVVSYDPFFNSKIFKVPYDPDFNYKSMFRKDINNVKQSKR